MPLSIPSAPCILIRRSAFERSALTRAEIDERFMLTDEEFRVEGELIVIGPLHDDFTAGELAETLEEKGLIYFDDFFDLSGNWPSWLQLFAMTARDATSFG